MTDLPVAAAAEPDSAKPGEPAPAAPLAEWSTELNTVLIGQPAVTEALLIALLAGGHVLLEGPPGVGKRLAGRALAASFGAHFAQLQCLPPAPGTALHPCLARAGAQGQVLLLTGLEQASLAAQAALGEALQATEVSWADGQPPEQAPVMLIASRNPFDPAGVVPLGEALLDRFLLAMPVAFPTVEDETRMVREVSLSTAPDMLAIAAPQRLFSGEDVARLQARRGAVKVDDALVNYAVRIVRATRFGAQFSTGAGPRAAIALVRCAQARALLHGREYAVAADIKACAPGVLRHRVRLAMAQRLDGVALEHVLADQLDQVGAPRP
ncbi:MoxR family ATPase [Pseudomonas sp. RIT-PI-S]|uniref:AAA family ATPase n=1 Tax=Pseudomonas sp. RIT-PI-S TaxID=3035295 RepID=UPI0021D9328E|nr:MoxR family ATPase [Pseudomonas sp. RIT-PI-S]